jgi:hypothetical protein
MPACCVRQWPAVSGNGLLCQAIACCVRQWPAVSGNGLLCQAMACCVRQWPAVSGNGLLCQAMACCVRQWPAVSGNGMLCQAMACCVRQWPEAQSVTTSTLLLVCVASSWLMLLLLLSPCCCPHRLTGQSSQLLRLLWQLTSLADRCAAGAACRVTWLRARVVHQPAALTADAHPAHMRVVEQVHVRAAVTASHWCCSARCCA